MKILKLLVASTLVVSSAGYAAETNDLDAYAETGPAKAAKQSVSFVENLDRDELLGGKFSTWVEFASDYVFRGESETNNGKIPSLKAAITWSHPSGIYLGYYGANNLFPGNNSEGNYSKINAIWGPYVGYTKSNIADTGLNYNGMFFQYVYPGDSASNYLEMFNYLDKQFGAVNMKLEYSKTCTDWFGYTGLDSHNIAIHPTVQIPYGFNLSGGLGYQFFNNTGPSKDFNNNGKEELNWVHWNAGISRNVYGYKVDLRYHDTDIERGHHDLYGKSASENNIVNGRFVFAVSKSL